jgi:hypothetical protein
VQPLIRSFKRDNYVADEGDILFYQQDPNLTKDLLKNGL